MMKKQEITNIAAKVVTFIINLGVSFFLTPFVVSNIGEEAYGFVGLANDFVSYAQIFTTALNSMASRFITIEYEKRNFNSARQYYSSLFFMNLLMAFLVTIIGSSIICNLENLVNVGNAPLSDIKVLWGFLLLNFIIGLINTVFSVATFCKNRLDLEAIRTALGIMIKAIILIICYRYFTPMVWYIGMGTIVAGAYTLIYNLKYTHRLMPDMKIDINDFQIEKIKILFKSGMWNSFTKVGTILRTGLDLIVTNLYVGSTQMGVMSISRTIPNYILNLFAVLSSVFTPRLVTSFARNDLDGMKKQINTAIRLCSIIACIPMVILLSCGYELFQLWVPTLDAGILYTITIVPCLGYIILLPFEPVWNIFTAFNKVKIPSIVLLSESAISLLIEFVLLTLVESSEARLIVITATSSVFVIVRSILFVPLYASYCMNFNVINIYKPIIKNIICTSILTITAFQFKKIFRVDSWFRLILFVLIIALLSLMFSIMVMLTMEERKSIKYIVLNFGGKKWKNIN